MTETFTGVLTTIWSQITTCVTTIESDSILLAPIAIGFVGAIIGLAKRFLRFGRRR